MITRTNNAVFFYFILYELYADQKFKMAAITAGFILA